MTTRVCHHADQGLCRGCPARPIGGWKGEEGNVQPTHTDACKGEDGKYTCLHAIDADHFWIGDLMVDMNILWRMVQQLSKSRMLGNSHSVVFNLQYLGHVAGELVRGAHRWISYEKAAKSLLKLNALGLHTGFSEEG